MTKTVMYKDTLTRTNLKTGQDIVKGWKYYN